MKLSLCCAVVGAFMLSSCQEAASFATDANAKTPIVQASATNPVVVELFQSQGCSSCPPANAALNAIADRPNVIALSFAVTYWDRLGWKDIFADKAYTQRQYDYARSLGNSNVYTPQIVINGARDLTGIKSGELAQGVSVSSGVSGGPAIVVENDTIKIAKGVGSADIWLVRYDPKIQNVAVRSGENGGRTLPHKNIVRSLTKLGKWDGSPVSYTLPKKSNPGWKTAILVQAFTGNIIAARAI